MLKTIIGTVAVVLTFVGYIPYTKDIIAGKTKPHIYSWFLWGFVTGIVFALQLSDGAGAGAFVTLTAALMCFLVIGLGFKYKSTSKITVSDKFFLAMAFVTLGIWLIAKQPIISALLATSIDLLGFAPTVRKSWNDPHSETLSFYFLNTARFMLAAISLSKYTLITALYPITWMFANGLFALMLKARRKKLSK